MKAYSYVGFGSLTSGGVLLLALSLGACQSAEATPSNTTTNSSDSGTDSSAPLPPIVIGAPDKVVTVSSVSVSPLELVPAFDKAISDYAIRCAEGDNTLTLSVTDSNGTTTTSVVVREDQAIDVQGYWIRCLPHDFPALATSYPTEGAGPTAGYYLVNGATYGMVLDTHGTPVWYTRGTAMLNLEVPQKNTISYIPTATAPFGYDPNAAFVLDALDAQTKKALRTTGSATDPHEFQRTADGHYWLLTYPRLAGTDLTGLQSYGSNEVVAGCEVQELDAEGSLLWRWSMSEHVDPRTESIEPSVFPVSGESMVDVFHCNAIDVDASGNLLVSARHTNALYYVDRASGRIQWKLGGSLSNLDGAEHIDVVGDPLGTFSMQHDARFRDATHISMFDNHGASSGVARGVEYELDFAQHKASVVFQFLGLGPSSYEGSFRRYADGQSVIGWGYVPGDRRIVTEIDRDGREVFDISSGGKESYRAIKVQTADLDLALLRDRTAK